MDKNLFELLVYTFSLYGNYDYVTSNYEDTYGIIHFDCDFYNSPMYKSFDVELTNKFTFTEAAEAILEAFNKRLED